MSSTPNTISTATTGDTSSYEGQDSAVRPSEDDVKHTLAYSACYWETLTRKALSTRMNAGTIQLGKPLHRMTAMPENLHGITAIKGYTSWELASGGCIGGLSTKREGVRSWRLALPWRRPTVCSITSRPSFKYEDDQLNGVSLMFLGWAYALSMALLERQGLAMQYPIPRGYDQDVPCVVKCPFRLLLYPQMRCGGLQGARTAQNS